MYLTGLYPRTLLGATIARDILPYITLLQCITIHNNLKKLLSRKKLLVGNRKKLAIEENG